MVTSARIEGRQCKQVFMYIRQQAAGSVKRTGEGASIWRGTQGLIPHRGSHSPRWPKPRNVSLGNRTQGVVKVFSANDWHPERAEPNLQAAAPGPNLEKSKGQECREWDSKARRFLDRASRVWPQQHRETQREALLTSWLSPSTRLVSYTLVS